MRVARLVLALPLLVLSHQAAALEMEFYTYNGFTEMVNAFKRLALIFGNNEYLVLFAVAAVLGIFFGGLFWAAKAVVGGGGSTLPMWLLSVFVGVAVFKGLIMPKGSLHVYDPVQNAYEEVGGIPDIIVLVAGMSNKLERAMQRITDTGSAHPYSKEAGGLYFSMIWEAFDSPLFADDYYMKKTLETYYLQCSGQALARTGSGLTYDSLRYTASDLLAEFEKMKHTMFFTQTYNNGAAKAGVSMTCAAAFDSVIKPALINAGAYDNFAKLTCLKTGFKVSEVAQWLTCQTRLSDANVQLFGGTGDYRVFIRNLHLASAISNAMLDANPEVGMKAITNFNIMTKGIGAAVAANEWLPKARASVLGIVLGIVPLLALFVVTPIYARALQLMVVLILWVSIWGVIDVVASQMIIDQAYSAAAEINGNGLGMVAFLTAPESASQGLAVIGTARGMGAVIASFICAVLFKVSAAGFTSMASNWSGVATSEGSASGVNVFSPDGHTEKMRGLRQAKADGVVGGEHGNNYLDSMAIFDVSRQAATANSAITTMSDVTGGFNPSLTGTIMGTGVGAHDASEAKAKLSLSPGNNPVEQMATIESQMGYRAGEAIVGAYKGNVAADRMTNTSAVERTSTGEYVKGVMDYNQSLLTEQVAGRFHDNNPDMGFNDAFKALAEQQMAPTIGAARASGYDPGRFVDAKEIESRREIAGAEAYRDIVNDNHLTDRDIAMGQQSVSVANAVGDLTSINEVGMGATMQGARVAQTERSMHGVAVEQAARTENQTVKERTEQMADIQQGAQTANANLLDILSSKTGRSVDDVQKAQAMATGNSLILDGETIEGMQEKGAIQFSEHQMELSRNGGRIIPQFTSDGQNVGTHFTAGNDVSSTDRTTVDKSTSYSLAMKLGEGDALEMLDNNERKELVTFMGVAESERGVVGDSQSGKEVFLNNLARSTENLMRSDLSKIESESIGVNGNAKFDFGTKTKGGGVGISGGANSSMVETDNFNVNTQVFRNLWDDARAAADKEMFTSGYRDKTDPDYAERQIPIMADYFARFSHQAMDHIRQQARIEAKGTDLLDETDMKPENPAITGRSTRDWQNRY